MAPKLESQGGVKERPTPWYDVNGENLRLNCYVHGDANHAYPVNAHTHYI